ncbi:Hypothetical protein SMAX5B_001590 [Scophthalmus maximus]|uniref:Uncharacterized protein n=1 Tax=Scophthalmus maximus TaxID=52904 RepID=A0A2U9CYW1_SCOMX|nr:Hypothetical protein SMAX5B_001590 [Scophthalmus maximus]
MWSGPSLQLLGFCKNVEIFAAKKIQKCKSSEKFRTGEGPDLVIGTDQMMCCESFENVSDRFKTAWISYSQSRNNALDVERI